MHHKRIGFAVLLLMMVLTLSSFTLTESRTPKRKRLTRRQRIEMIMDSLKTNDSLRMAAVTIADQVIDEAMKYLGTPYRYGSSGPNSFDCSGFTSFIYRKFGVQLARSSTGQSQDGVAVKSIAELHRGDIVYFGGSNSMSVIGHVGIVVDVFPEISDFTFIHAATSGGIRIDRYEQYIYYKKRYIGARRVIL